MAFLLLLHEKMRLKRKVNTMTLRQAKLANRKSRIADRITRMQKMFAKQTAMLEKQSSIWSNQFKANIYNSMGLGTQGQMFNPMYGGITTFVANQIGSLMAGGVPVGEKGEDGKPTLISFSSDKYQELMSEYTAGTLKATTDESGNTIKGQYGSNGQFTEQEYKAFMMALNQAQNNQAYASNYCQQMSQQYETNLSIWLEAQRNDLEDQQEQMLLPLEVEQEEIEMETTGLETQLQDARARLEALEQACSQEVKDSVPKFGLG